MSEPFDSPLSSEITVGRLLVMLAERDAVIGQQAQAIVDLTAQVTALQARLGQNPRNSSRPPSSEGYGKPAPRSQRRASGRRPGGQDGAPGTTLRQVAEPDRGVEHAPAVCRGCGAGLAAAPVVSSEARQVFDLPPIALQVVEHRLQHRRCGCGTVTMAGPVDGVPAGVGAPAQYGPGVRAVATYLAGAQHLPLARTADTLADLLGAPVSVGTVAAMLQQAAAGLGPFTEAVRGQLAASPVVHFDETGLRVDGALAWVHSASTGTLTQVTVHPRRGIVAMQAAGVLPDLDGVAVHDGWKPYRHYDRDPVTGRGVRHGLCNAHHLRELTAVTEAATQDGTPAAAGSADSQDWASAMSRLLVEIHHTVRSGSDHGASALSAALLATYQTRYDAIITAGHSQNPATAGRRNSKAANLLARLDTQRVDVLRFATDWSVPFDNNLAERDIRMVKIRQKISGCLRTTTGAEAFCALRSYLSTARKQGHNALDVLRQLTEGQPWIPDPRTC